MTQIWHRIRGGPMILLIATLFIAGGFGLLVNQPAALAAPVLQEDEGETDAPAPEATEESAEATEEPAASETGAEAPTMPQNEDHSGQNCGDCHLDYHAEWAEGAHATAFSNDNFQMAWEERDNNPACLECHATEYQPATETFLRENVDCEACHGVNPPDHPPEPFIVDTSAEACGDCHVETFEQWESSLHAFTEDMGAIGCATCHNPHGQNIRFDTVDGLCLNCHNNEAENLPVFSETFAHRTHQSAVYGDIEVNCASCHLYEGDMDELHNIADHSMEVTTVVCTDCHTDLAATGTFEGITDVETTLLEEREALEARVEELESELLVIETEEPEEEVDFILLTQGLILGLGLGVSIIWVFIRRGNNNPSTRNE